MAFSERAKEILEKNYYHRDSNGDLVEKSPEDLFHRVSTAIFPDDDELAYALYDALMGQKVIFNSPVLFNIGLPTKQILAACWVGDLQDNMESILEAAKVTGMVFKYGSGMGLPMTNLRPKNDVVSNSGYASGPISFMHLFDTYGEVIKSGGKRRAAFMAMNSVHHPDIVDIISSKSKAVGGLGEQPLENMNISISVTDEFMKSAKQKSTYPLKFKGRVYREENAEKILNLIAENAWRSGDPGVFFYDTVNAVNPLPRFATIESTNPCVAEGTIIHTTQGHFPIEDLVEKSNIKVYCIDEFENVCIGEVDSVFKTRENADTLKFTVSSGNTLTVTPDHKIYISSIGWKKAEDVKLGHKFFIINPKTLQLQQVTVTKIENGPIIDVYDMIVPGYNNFTANNIVVHNCGEQPLHPWTCCNLGHINLRALLKTDSKGNKYLDFEELVSLAKLMTIALDRIIDIMDFPSEQFRKNTLMTRPIGLGFTGYAEVLYALRIPYSNSQSFIKDITQLLTASAIEQSIELAIHMGSTPVLDEHREHIAELALKYSGDIDLYHAIIQHGIRNSTWTTLAPTGTTTLALDAGSYGIEPHFGLVYIKNFVDQNSDTVADKKYYVNQEFMAAIKELDIPQDKLIKDLLDNKGSCQNLDYIPESVKRVFEVAQDLTPSQHLQICAAAQQHISSAISKTINLPNSATVEDIKNVIFTAWEHKLKGVTVYRDGCKEFQPISFSDESSIDAFKRLPRGASIPRGESTVGGEIDAWKTACTKMYVMPGYSKDYEDVLIETFLSKKSGGGCDSNLKAIALLVSLGLRKGIQVKDIADELFSITCTHCVSAKAQGKDITAMSCPQAIAKTLRKQKDQAVNYSYVTSEEPKKVFEVKNAVLIDDSRPLEMADNKCPKCQEPMIIVTGCITCPSCGFGGCDSGR